MRANELTTRLESMYGVWIWDELVNERGGNMLNSPYLGRGEEEYVYMYRISGSQGGSLVQGGSEVHSLDREAN
jgi:hypothetical protein